MSGWFGKSPKKAKLPKEILVISDTPVYARNKHLQKRSSNTDTRLSPESNNDNRQKQQQQRQSGVTRSRSKSRSKSDSMSPSSHLVSQQQQQQQQQQRARSKSASRRDSSRTASAPESQQQQQQQRSRSKSASRRGSSRTASTPEESQQRARSKSISRRESSRTADLSTHSRKSELSRSSSWKSTASSSKGGGGGGASSSHSRNLSGDDGLLIRSISGRSIGGDGGGGGGGGSSTPPPKQQQPRRKSLNRSASGRSSGRNSPEGNSSSHHSRKLQMTPTHQRNLSSSSNTPLSTATTTTAPASPTKRTSRLSTKTMCCGEPSEWHTAILQQDWVRLERLLKSFNPLKYKKEIVSKNLKQLNNASSTTPSQPKQQEQSNKKPQRKLRVLKYLPKLGGSSSSGVRGGGKTTSSSDDDDIDEDDNNDNNNNDDDEGEDENTKNQIISPLLQVDTQGRTPLHYACKEQHIPKKLLLRLIHCGRDATCVLDQDGRLPLHIAILFQNDPSILDKIIRAYPNALQQEDCLNQTPTVYVVRQAIHQGTSARVAMSRTSVGAAAADWRVPTSATHSEWQTLQTATWNKVKFVLETLEMRRRPLTKRHTPEADLILEALQNFAPPPLILQLLKLSSIKFLLPQGSGAPESYGTNNDTSEDSATAMMLGINQANEARCIKALSKMFQNHYPLTIIQTLLRIMAKHMTPNIRATIRQGYVDHYQEGCISFPRPQQAEAEDTIMAVAGGGALSFRSELLETQRQRQMGSTVTASLACQEWWTKLRFLIRICSPNLQDGEKLLDDYILHAGLSIPETPPSLVELLVRLMPYARYEIDPATGALPIHLACRFWAYDDQKEDMSIDGNSKVKLKRASSHTSIKNTSPDGAEDETTVEMALNLLLAGDFSLVWKRYKSRLPLHHAIIAGKRLNILQTLIALDIKTANVRDPITKLYPFQLAAKARETESMLATPILAALSADENHDINTTTNTSSINDEQLQQAVELEELNTVYELLRTNPIAITPPPKLGDLNHLPSGVVIGPVAKHYLEWCYTYKRGSSGHGSWVVNTPQMKALRDAVCSGDIPTVLEQWWAQMKFWLWLSYDNHGPVAGKPKGPANLPHKDEYLLHAALFNEETPPFVVELILELYGGSVSMPIPGTDIYPLHIAAGTPAYSPMPFEQIVSMGSTMEMLLIIHPPAAHIECDCRLPIHIALAGGKTWNEIKPLVDKDPNFLCTIDSVSSLFPFQLLAARHTSVPSHKLISRASRLVDWGAQAGSRGANSMGGGTLIRGIQKEYHLDVLTSVFEALRRNPEALVLASLVAQESSNQESWSSSLTKGIQSFLDSPCT